MHLVKSFVRVFLLPLYAVYRTECCTVTGLKTGEVNKPQTFTIETRGAGQGGVGLSVVGPTEPKIGCVDNHDGTLTVEYLPNSVGNYEISVSFADQPVPGLHTSLTALLPPTTTHSTHCLQ